MNQLSNQSISSSISFERPLLIYELKMQARDAVRSDPIGAHGCDHRDLILCAGDAHETPACDIERGEDCGPASADVLRHSRLAGCDLPLLIEHFDGDFDGNVVARFGSRLI